MVGEIGAKDEGENNGVEGCAAQSNSIQLTRAFLLAPACGCVVAAISLIVSPQVLLQLSAHLKFGE